MNPGYLEQLNPKQLEAVQHFGSPLLILAGAGSGKTRVITTKIAYLVDQKGIDPASVLAVAFTNKAADEMRERVLQLTPAARGVMIRTFHAFGAWLLRRHSHLLDLPQHFVIYDEDDSVSLLRNALDRKLPAARLRELYRCITRAKDRCLLPEDDLSACGESGEVEGIPVADAYRVYQQRMRETGNVDFADLLLLSVYLLENHEQVRRRISRRFQIIMVDEYQDSNYAQFLLLSQLFSSDNYLCVVGDEDQSIYGFRGAEVRNILEFPNHFPETTIVRLEQNYRSTQTILQVATAVVQHNVNRLGKTLWTDKEMGLPVTVARLENQDEEAQFCADILQDGRYAETAILYRMNFQSRVFETLFSSLGIPFRVVGTARFYEREEVKDILAYLSLLLNPRDEIALRRVLNKPKRGIGSKTVQKILAVAAGNLIESCRRYQSQAKGKAAVGLQTFVVLMDMLAQRIDVLPLAAVVKELLRESGLMKLYSERDQAEHTERVLNLEELVNATVQYAAGRDALSRFLEGTGLNSAGENPFRSANKATLITVHNTKGLEFDRVIITGLEDGIFPHYASTTHGLPVAGEDLEEERRLFYVGVTRAKDTLYLTSCRNRRMFGAIQSSEPSQFLKEIPDESVQRLEPVVEEDLFPLGSGVYHDEYGSGMIAEKWIHEGEPMVIVRFDSGQSARFALNYTPLERISLDP